MKNPWEEISLSDYENHMSLGSVRQLQALNGLMKEQLGAYPAGSAVIFGAAGGNGLEHISTDKYHTVYAVDINREYLKAVSERFGDMSGVLKCLCLDLTDEAAELPQAQLVIADLLIEYIGYAAFQRAVRQVSPEYVSCVIQVNTDENSWVSDSPYLHAFDGLDAVHHHTDKQELTAAMIEIGYQPVLRSLEELPNGKALLRLDFKRQ